MTTIDPDVLVRGGLIPPPFMSKRKIWTNPNASSISTHDITNTGYQEHRVGYHPMVGSGTKSQVYSTAVNNSVLSTAKIPISAGPSLPLANCLVATYLIAIIVFSLGANFLVMLIASRKRSLGKSKSNHIFSVSLAAADLILPLMMHSIIATASLGFLDLEKLFLGQGCSYYGFGAIFFGFFPLCIHASVSVIRYVNICHPEKVEWLEVKYVYILLVLCVIYSGTWALGPFTDWERFENYDFDCSVALQSNPSSRRHKILKMIAIIAVLFIPLGTLVTCYALIVLQSVRFQRELSSFTGTMMDNDSPTKPWNTDGSQLIRSLRRRSPDTPPDEEGQRVEEAIEDDQEGPGQESKTKEKIVFDRGSVKRTQRSLRVQAKLIRMSMMVAGGYLLAWLPYATVCIWVSYGDVTLLPEGVRLGTSLFCKSSTVYNPIIYFYMSETFRDEVRKFFCRNGGSQKVPSPVPVQVSRAPSRRGSIRSFEAASVRSRSLREESFRHPVPSIRKTSTSTLGSSTDTDNSLRSSTAECHASIEIASPLRRSPGLEQNSVPRLLTPSSPTSLHRMQSLPHSKSLYNRSPNQVRRLSSTPFREPGSPRGLPRRSSCNVMSISSSTRVVSTSPSRQGLGGKPSSSSLRLPPTHSPNLSLNRDRRLSQSFRAPSPSMVTVHRTDSWMDPKRRGKYQTKSAKEIQRDLEDIISNEFHGEPIFREELRDSTKGGLTRKKSLRSPVNMEVASRPPVACQRQRLSLHESVRRTSNPPDRKEKLNNFLEIPTITKTNWDQQDRGPVRSRSLHGRPPEYRNDYPKNSVFSEY